MPRTIPSYRPGPIRRVAASSERDAWLHRIRHLVAPAATALTACLGLGGCATEPAPTASVETTKYTLENTDKFVLLDKGTLRAVTGTGLHTRPLADGPIEVIANLRNRDTRPIKVETSCLFRDGAGQPTGEETAWQPIAIAENTTETVRFTAPSVAAKNYTIRVRQAR